jgi:hypothetical protein
MSLSFWGTGQALLRCALFFVVFFSAVMPFGTCPLFSGNNKTHLEFLPKLLIAYAREQN